MFLTLSLALPVFFFFSFVFQATQYLLFFDDDDILMPGALNDMVAVALRTNADVVVGWTAPFRPPTFSSPVRVLSVSARLRLFAYQRGDISLPLGLEWEFFFSFIFLRPGTGHGRPSVRVRL
jgi:cellulose synthase/poly-beta-1,6-N-acetylglucosamine synthase-like glycosyltransferase